MSDNQVFFSILQTRCFVFVLAPHRATFFFTFSPLNFVKSIDLIALTIENKQTKKRSKQKSKFGEIRQITRGPLQQVANKIYGNRIITPKLDNNLARRGRSKSDELMKLMRRINHDDTTASTRARKFVCTGSICKKTIFFFQKAITRTWLLRILNCLYLWEG